MEDITYTLLRKHDESSDLFYMTKQEIFNRFDNDEDILIIDEEQGKALTPKKFIELYKNKPDKIHLIVDGKYLNNNFELTDVKHAFDVTYLENDLFGLGCILYGRYRNENFFISKKKTRVRAIFSHKKALKLHYNDKQFFFLYNSDKTKLIPTNKHFYTEVKIVEADIEVDVYFNNYVSKHNSDLFPLNFVEPLEKDFEQYITSNNIIIKEMSVYLDSEEDDDNIRMLSANHFESEDDADRGCCVIAAYFIVTNLKKEKLELLLSKYNFVHEEQDSSVQLNVCKIVYDEKYDKATYIENF